MDDTIRARTRIIRETDAEIARILQEGAARVAAILAGQPTDYQRWYLPQIMAEIERVLRERGDALALATGDATTRVWQAGEALVANTLRAAEVRAVLPRIDTTQLEAMRSFLTGRVRGITVAEADAVNAQLGLVIIGAQNPFEAQQSIARLVGDPARAGVIARTELARAFSTASHESLQAAGEVVPGMKKKWLKSGKRMPRMEHVAINGQTVAWNEPFRLYGGQLTMRYPHDPRAPARETINCGCVMVPIPPGRRSR